MNKLQSPVLVLNKSWVPITIISADRALAMLFQDRARAIDADDYSTYDFESWADLGKIFDEKDYIKTAKLCIPIPDVLLLKDYSKVAQSAKIGGWTSNVDPRKTGEIPVQKSQAFPEYVRNVLVTNSNHCLSHLG